VEGEEIHHGGGVLELDGPVDVEVVFRDGAGRVGDEGGPSAQVDPLVNQGRGDVEADAGQAELDADGEAGEEADCAPAAGAAISSDAMELEDEAGTAFSA
jgi:hypothetical protein